MMWEVKGRPFPVELFAPFAPEQVLYDFDGPRIFTWRDRCAQLHLCYLCDEDERDARLLVVPTSQQKVDDLLAGRATVREALGQPCSYLIEEQHDGSVTAAWLIDQAQLPADVLPRPGTLILPSLRAPLLAAVPAERREKIRQAQQTVLRRGLWAA